MLGFAVAFSFKNSRVLSEPRAIRAAARTWPVNGPSAGPVKLSQWIGMTRVGLVRPTDSLQ